MSKKKTIDEEIEDSFIGLANNLPLSDVMRLIEINADRIKIFHYELSTLEDIDTVGFNGACIQISTSLYME